MSQPDETTSTIVTRTRPTPLWLRLGLIGIFIAAPGGAFWLRSHFTQNREPNGGLVVEKKDLDFGEVWEESHFSWNFPIRNGSLSTIEVMDFFSSCKCASIKPRAFSLLPGEDREMEIDLNLTMTPKYGENKYGENDVRLFKATIIPQIKSSIVRFEGWKIIGRVKPLMDVSPTNFDFGDKLIRGGKSVTKEVKITTAIPLDSLTAHCDQKQLRLKVCGANSLYFLEMVPNTDLPRGRFHFNVVLRPKKKGSRLPAKEVPVEGFVHEDIEALPSSLLLGAIPVGRTTDHFVRLVSHSGSNFSVENWKVFGEDTSVEHLSQDQKQFTCKEPAYRIIQRVGKIGHQKESLVFLVRTNTNRQVEVPVEIVYHGIR